MWSGTPTAGYPAKRARTRRALVRGAMTVMAEGVALTAAGVAQAAEVSTGTLYNHFDGIAELRAAVADQLAEVFELGAGAVATRSPDPAVRVAQGIRRILALPHADRTYAEAFLVSMSDGRAFRARVRARVAREVTAGLAAGVFQAPSEAVATDALVGAVLQALRTRLLGEGDAQDDAVVEVCLRLLGMDGDAVTGVIAALAPPRP